MAIFRRGVGHADVRQERVGILVIKRQRNADQNGGDEEHQVAAVLEQAQGVQPEHLLEAAAAGLWLQGCGARQR